MDNSSAESSSLAWLGFALLTVSTWGVYGILLHSGQLKMEDAANGRYKAFLWVGIAYFLTAVLAPIVVLLARGATWRMPVDGIAWSLAAGIVGAIGAFSVLLAFGAKGSPAVVMAIVFAGSPVVNSLLAITLHPPAKGWTAIPWQFFVGILLAAAGGALVTLYRPPPPKPTPKAGTTIKVPDAPPAPPAAAP